MKSLLITMLLAILPIVNQRSNEVTIQGNIDPLPGQAIELGVSPYNSSYTYMWDCEGNWEVQEQSFDFSISGNQITITPKKMEERMLRLYCIVLDENGNNIGQGEAEIIWRWR